MTESLGDGTEALQEEVILSLSPTEYPTTIKFNKVSFGNTMFPSVAQEVEQLRQQVKDQQILIEFLYQQIEEYEDVLPDDSV